MPTPNDPLDGLARLSRLAIYRDWHDDRIYDHPSADTLYPSSASEPLRLRIPTARIITNRHLGLEIKAPPTFRVADEPTEAWLGRILKINGVPGSMRGAAKIKSWAGDVGLLFAWKPRERAELGTAWQVGFVAPDAYDVVERHASGVFKAVDLYTYEDRLSPVTQQPERWWRRERYTRDTIHAWPEERGDIGAGREAAQARMDALAVTDARVKATANTMGVIPFVVIQNRSDDVQSWAGVSDYETLTPLFHRLNVHLDSVEQGEQLRNRLLAVLIDAEEVEALTAAGMTTLGVKSRDGGEDRQAQFQPAPLLQNSGTQLDFYKTLLDQVMEAAGAAQTGTAKEVFGNEAASASSLQTFYAMQAAVAEHKRANWLGERADFGLSAFLRKLLLAAARLDRDSPVYGRGVDELNAPQYDLTLDWPPMFALSAPERQTLASVAQQANDEGLPADHIAPIWAQVLGRAGLQATRDIARALKDRQAQVDAGGLLRPPGTVAARGILGSGQGDGLLPNGGSANPTVNPAEGGPSA